MRRPATGVLAAVALTLLAACGSDAGVSQPDDELLDLVEASCRTGEREADKIDLSEAGSDAVSEYVDIITTVQEDIEDLDPPTRLKKDFDNFVGDLDDQIKQGKRLANAIDGGDSVEISDETAALSDLVFETNNSAKALGALQCRDISPDFFLLGTDTADTVPDLTVPVDTTPDTEPVDTIETTVETVADTTVDTVIDTTVETVIDTTVDTLPPEFSADLSLVAAPPAGYTWVSDYTQTDIAELKSTTVLGPKVLSYEAGRAIDGADGTAYIFVITISEPWSDGTIEQWLVWERLDEGTEATTPAGYTVTVMPEAFTDTDCLGYYTGSYGIALCTDAGVDGKPILDAFIAANPR